MRARLTAALLAGVACCVVVQATAVDAASTRKLKALKVDPQRSDDRIYNYDFNSERRSRKNVDWGVNLLFYNNAEVDKIKAALIYGTPGGKQNARMKDGSSWLWDEDGGRKQGPCPIGTSTAHYRVYANQDGDRNYSRGLGFYVIGSSHRDVNECGGGTRYFGDSEAVETELSAIGASARGWQVFRNNYDMRNKERRRREGDHRWYSDGLATMFIVP